MNRFRFTKVRDVKSPQRSNQGDAGIDFFTPVDLTYEQLLEANSKVSNMNISRSYMNWKDIRITKGPDGYVDKIFLRPNARVIIPSGILGLIEPVDSALIAANKSGVSTKKGLVYTAQVVDSTYTGEIHICVVNTSSSAEVIEMGTKLVQFMHLPVYLTTPEEIDVNEFHEESKEWSNRGSNWQGSTDNK